MESGEHAERATSQQKSTKEYNYDHFHPVVMSDDIQLNIRSVGPHPGDMAPEFILQDTEGRTWQLSDLRGRPVVLVLGSASCPLTLGALPAFREVYRDFGGRTQWLLMYVREAHPGMGLPAHKTYEQKLRQADFFRRDDRIEWPVIVDELDGTTHRDYGMLPNSVFVIDVDGRVVFRGNVSHGPTLRRALDHLFAQDRRGTVSEGEDHMMHLLGATAYGWEAIQRSGEDAVHHIVVGLPPLAANLWMGRHLRPAIDPIARRSRPLSAAVKVGVAAGMGLFALGVWKAVRSASR